MNTQSWSLNIGVTSIGEMSVAILRSEWIPGRGRRCELEKLLWLRPEDAETAVMDVFREAARLADQERRRATQPPTT